MQSLPVQPLPVQSLPVQRSRSLSLSLARARALALALSATMLARRSAAQASAAGRRLAAWLGALARPAGARWAGGSDSCEPPQRLCRALSHGSGSEPAATSQPLDWKCRHTWRRAAVNTSWCLLGCSIGEFGTLGLFQALALSEVTWWTVALPVANGIATSIALESAILVRQGFAPDDAVKTAAGMSLASMVCMELAMEVTDLCLTGGLTLQLWAVPPMLLSGFLAPLPYNYWRLKRLGKGCH